MSEIRNATAATLASVANKSSHAGAGVAIVGGLTANEIAAFGGLAVAVIGAIVGNYVNWLYRHREYQLKVAEFERKSSQ